MLIKPFVFLLMSTFLTSIAVASVAMDDEPPEVASEPTAADIIRSALNHWRGTSSYSEMTLTIRRADWQRRLSMRGWTQGDKHSLVRITQPKKDAGSGTLLNDNSLWTYAPKVNRVIRIPSSMMRQSWMGSDFSNKDIAKSDDIIEQYKHRIMSVRREDNHRIYVIESIPYEDAPVVWGREVLTVRDDYILLKHQFYDQDGQLVKALTTLTIENMSGRSVATLQRMAKVNVEDEWTEIRIEAIDFNVDIRPTTFTLSNLRNPRDR